MLEYGAACLYARRVVIASNKDLARVMPALRLRRELRWAWLLEGAARWFGGQTAHARPAIARRLREGRPPSFPPGPRDAALLGGTVIDLLAREEGAQAAARFACRLHRAGAAGGAVTGVRRPRTGAHRGGVALASLAAGRRSVNRQRQQPDEQGADGQRHQQAGEQPPRVDRTARPPPA